MFNLSSVTKPSYHYIAIIFSQKSDLLRPYNSRSLHGVSRTCFSWYFYGRGRAGACLRINSEFVDNDTYVNFCYVRVGPSKTIKVSGNKDQEFTSKFWIECGVYPDLPIEMFQINFVVRRRVDPQEHGHKVNATYKNRQYNLTKCLLRR